MAAPPLVYARFKAPEAHNGTLDVYEAGSLQNRKTTYSNPDLTGANANPVLLDALGEADVFYTGLARLVLKNEAGSQIWDKDDIGFAADTSSEWINTFSATYSSSTQFTISGDQTTEYHVNRRIRLTGSSTAYGRITATSYSAPNTTVTVVLTSGTLDATLASVAVSVISGNSSSGIDFSHIQGSDVLSATTTNLDTVIGDYCHITSTNAITGITLTKGREITVVFDDVLTLTNGASLLLPGSGNITTAAGDTAVFRGEASGVVRCIDFVRRTMTLSSVSGYVSGTRLYIATDPSTTGNFDVSGNITENTFESIGPTGSGATNIWAAMDVLPSTARILMIGCTTTVVTDGTDRSSSCSAYARMTGGSEAVNAAQEIGRITFPNDDYTATGGTGQHITFVPLDSSRRFDATWLATNDTARSVTLYVRGFVV